MLEPLRLPLKVILRERVILHVFFMDIYYDFIFFSMYNALAFVSKYVMPIKKYELKLN